MNKSIIILMIFVFIICFEPTNAQVSADMDSSSFVNYDSVINNSFTINEIKHFREYIRNYVVFTQ